MKKSLLLIAFFISSICLHSQNIDVNPTGTPESSMTLEQLIENVFLGQSCATVTNITSVSRSDVRAYDQNIDPITNTAKSFAYFTYAGANFPIDRGIILSNGAATETEGGNTYRDLTGLVNSGWPGDADLKTILDNNIAGNEQTYNATIVEFDFTPLDNVFSFQYLFSSEEYTKGLEGGFECTPTYQDGFAFILSGPGIPNDPGITGTNIAVLPGGQIVSSGTIRSNAGGCPAVNTALYNSPGNAANPINFNGWTDLLTASHAVTPGTTYHMKMVIADRGDETLDSAVFLQASPPSSITVDLGNDINVCSDNFPTTLTATTTGTNASTNYSWLFNGTTIAGENNQTYNATQPGTYTCYITQGNLCATDNITVSSIQAPNAGNNGSLTICTGTTVTAAQLFAELGGNPDTGGSWTPALAGSGTYTYTVTGTTPCNNDMATVTVNDTLPTANAGSDGTITCTTTSVQIGAASAAGFTYSWSPATGLDDATISNPTSTAAATTTYTLTITETATGCTDTDDVTVTVDSG
ncbi:choice-of-anchor L domain-containing protein, partial [Pseudofulvibacter geojedonensis]